MAKLTNTKPGTESELALRKKHGDFGPYIKRYWQLYALLALPLLYLLVFKYAPMIYIQIAFKKYKPRLRVFHQGFQQQGLPPGSAKHHQAEFAGSAGGLPCAHHLRTDPQRAAFPPV